MTHPMVDVQRYLFGLIDGDSTLETALGKTSGDDYVWSHPAPEDAEFPLVTIQFLGSGDRLGVDRARLLVRSVWMVRVIDRDTFSYADIESAADRVDVLLQGAGGSQGDVTQIAVARIAGLMMSEDDDGTRYMHLGGQYECQHHEA